MPSPSGIDNTPLLPPEGADESKMSDLPKWAQGEGDEAAAGDLEDKLVDESGESKPTPSADPASDAEDARPAPQESPLASRALCFFRCLSVLTVILALVVIGTNCYIIYKRYNEIKGELMIALPWWSKSMRRGRKGRQVDRSKLWLLIILSLFLSHVLAQVQLANWR